ncbi:MAG: hypothetical protein AAGA30_21215, partial [Planctomycetota bacterium]
AYYDVFHVCSSWCWHELSETKITWNGLNANSYLQYLCGLVFYVFQPTGTNLLRVADKDSD